MVTPVGRATVVGTSAGGAGNAQRCYFVVWACRYPHRARGPWGLPPRSGDLSGVVSAWWKRSSGVVLEGGGWGRLPFPIPTGSGFLSCFLAVLGVVVFPDLPVHLGL